MISVAELTGIVNVLGAVTFEEICNVDREISDLRQSVQRIDELQKLCIEAVEEHLLESISAEDVYGAEVNGTTYFIIGPNAFPDIPFELSEVIDILKLPIRKVDMSSIAMKLLQNLQKRLCDLDMEISCIECDIEGIQKLEVYYSDLLNLYYDYDSWLPGKFVSVAEHLMEISKRIEHLK